MNIEKVLKDLVAKHDVSVYDYSPIENGYYIQMNDGTEYEYKDGELNEI